MESASKLIKQSCELYQKHFGLIIGYTAWLLLPYAGIVLFSLPKSNAFLEIFSFVFSIIQGFLALWLGILIPLLIRELINSKTKIPLLSLQNKAWQLISSVVFVAILETAVVLGGFILLIIPAFIFWVWFAMAQFSVILENKKGLEAMAYSRELSRHKFWPLTWRLIAGPAFFSVILMLAVGLLISVVAAIFGFSVESLLGPTPPLWAELISMVIETFSIPLFLIYYTLLYLDLTQIKNPSSTTSSNPIQNP